MVILLELIRQNYFCYYGVWSTERYYDGCIFGNYFQDFIKPLFLMLLGLLITSIFTFFISNKIFKKWLIFTLIYFSISAIWIAIAPESSGQFITILQTKEEISMFLAPLFVFISLTMFILLSIKEKRGK